MTAAPDAAELAIRSVVVHPDGARVTRRGAVVPVDGVVWVRKLPLLLDPTSVRASLGATPIASVSAELDLLDEDREERPRLLEAWTKARTELAALDARISANDQLRATIAGMAPRYVAHPERPVPAPERFVAWAQIDHGLSERIAALDDDLRADRIERTRRAEALSVLQFQLSIASSESYWRRWVPTRRVAIRAVGGFGDGAVEVELSYRVPGASWSPAYTLDADDALRTGRFAMRATIAQATGEDWTGVALTVSSAPSARAVDVPELDAQRLGTYQPPRATGWRPLPADLDALFPSDAPTPPRESTEVTAGFGVDSLDDIDADDRDADDDGDDEEPAIDALGGAPSDGRGMDKKDAVQLDSLGSTAPRRSAPMAAIRPQAAPKSRSSGMVAATLAAPVAAMVMAGEAVATRRRAGGGGAPAGAPPPRPAEPELDEVDARTVAYGALRLEGPDAGPGKRGRLRPMPEPHLLRERGVPDAGVERFVERRTEAHARSNAVSGRALPPHHVLPAPLDHVDVVIDAAGAVDIPSDGAGHSVAVVGWPAELAVAYRAVPRADPRAFRRVTARLTYTRPLLPGPVDVYVGGKLELTSPWAGSSGRGELKIGLGAEDRLKVVRNVRYREESAGMFGGSRRLHTAIEVSVASSLARPVKVEILDRVPIDPAGKDVAVEITEASPVAEPYTGEPDGAILKGGRSQTVDLPPGGEAKAILAYAVTLGAKDEIVGGDRRG